MPKGTPSLFAASLAISCPTLVILKAVRFTVSQSVSKSAPRTSSRAHFTTPGPLTPTLMQQSASPTPWNAPAINGLSSTALQKTTSFAQPMHSLSFVNSAVLRIISPISFTASMFSPLREVPMFTEEQTISVSARACGIDAISLRSLSV